MIIVYVAGPLSARSAWGREANVRSALTTALDVAKHDMAFICVHAWGERFWEEIDEEHALRMDFVLIERCDAVLLAPGWQRSNGTGREIVHCHEISKPVFIDIADLVHWRDHGGGGYSNALQMGSGPRNGCSERDPLRGDRPRLPAGRDRQLGTAARSGTRCEAIVVRGPPWGSRLGTAARSGTRCETHVGESPGLSPVARNGCEYPTNKQRRRRR